MQLWKFFFCVGAGVFLYQIGFAATQVVAFSSSFVQEIQITHPIGELAIGMTPEQKQEKVLQGKYAVTTNGTGMKILGYIDAPMPPHMQLLLKLAPPTGAVSLGFQPLSLVPIELVIDVTRLAERDLPMVAIFRTTELTCSQSPFNRLITLTLIKE